MQNLSRVLVFGATGAQGSPVAQQLIEKGVAVRAATRDANKVRELYGDKAEAVEADLNDLDLLRNAFTEVDAAFFHVPWSIGATDGEQAFKHALQAAKEANLPKLIFTTGASAFDALPPFAMVQALRTMSDAVLSSGIPSVVLRPTIYLQNLLQPHVLQELNERGTLSYPPLDPNRKVSWTALEDQATLAIAAMTSETAVGKAFEIVSPEPVTGNELAALLSKKLKREISYAPLTPEKFAIGIAHFAGEETGNAIAEFYKATDMLPEDGAVIDLEPVLSVLPVKLTTVSEWIERQSWQQ